MTCQGSTILADMATVEPRLLRYSGHDHHGKAQTGATDNETPEQLIQRLWKAEWRDAVVFDAVNPTEVAGAIEKGAKGRVWWADR